MGLNELLEDPLLKDHAIRVANVDHLNQALQAWIGRRTLDVVMDTLVPTGGVVGPVYDFAQIVQDPHYLARDDILEIEDPDLGRTRMLGVVPKFSETPGRVTHAGPRLGEHNAQVYGEWLAYDESRLAQLARDAVI